MMENKVLIVSVVIFTLYHVTSGAYITREILAWVPDKKRRIKLLLFLWLIPVIGINLANRKGRLGLFEESNDKSSTTARMGLLEVEEILNPGARHRVEAVEKQRTELSTTISQPDQASLPNQNKSSHTTKPNEGL